MYHKSSRPRFAPKSGLLLFGAPGERTFSRVKVPKSPGSGKNFAKGKGVRREAESEESRVDQAPKAIFLTAWRKIILLIPLIFLLPHLCPDAVTGVYLAEPIADTIAVCTTAPMFYAYYRKLK